MLGVMLPVQDAHGFSGTRGTRVAIIQETTLGLGAPPLEKQGGLYGGGGDGDMGRCSREREIQSFSRVFHV